MRNDLHILKDELKVLKTMETTPLERNKIPNFRKLYEADIIHDVYTGEVDQIGCEIPSGKYTVTDEYWRYKESQQWFNWEFVLRNILVPIVVGVLSVIITKCLIGS